MLKPFILSDYFDHEPRSLLILVEESYTIRDMHEKDPTDKLKLSEHDLNVMHLRSRFNCDLSYYLVDCDCYFDLGLSYDYVMDMIKSEYYKGLGKCKLEEKFSNIKRI
jgi:hypothetical protein